MHGRYGGKNGESLIAVYRAAQEDLGWLLAHDDQLDEAVRECREAIRLEPNFAAAHDALALALDKRGALDEAVREYRAADTLAPTDRSRHRLAAELEKSRAAKRAAVGVSAGGR